MKKLLIGIMLGMTVVALEAMMQREVPQLSTIIEQDFMKKAAQGLLDPRQLFNAIQTLPDEIRESIPNVTFIASFGQHEPTSQTNTLAGFISKFPDDSVRIDNYLGIGDTLFLSSDLQRYLHINAEGKVVVNSRDKKHLKSTVPSSDFEVPVDYYEFPQGIESQHYPYKVISSDADQEHGPFLKIRYPQDFEIEFKARSIKIIAGSPTLSRLSHVISVAPDAYRYSAVQFDNVFLLLSLHKAVANLDVDGVKDIISKMKLSLRKVPLYRRQLVDYVFITDNALHRAVKKGLTATDQQQLENAKAIVQMLIDIGTNLEQTNSDKKTALQLAAPNIGLVTAIEQAYLRSVLLDTIDLANKDKVNGVIVTLQRQDYTIPEFLNASYGTDTPLVHVLERALETTDKTQFKGYIDIAQLLINNGATLSNPSGRNFIIRYGKQYREKLAPHLTIQ